MYKFKKIQNRLLVSFGSLVLIIILLMSLTNYLSVRKSLMKDVKEKQLLSFVEASQSNIRVLIEKALETSQLIANDPTIMKWFIDAEIDDNLGKLTKDKLTELTQSKNYFTAFAINNITHNYWNENNILLDVLSETDPDDSWYFDFSKSNIPLVLNFDYNQELDKTLIFVDARMEYNGVFMGTAGVGIDPQKMITEFKKRRITDSSQLWLTDSKGNIKISQNAEEINSDLIEFVPAKYVKQALTSNHSGVIDDVIINNKSNELAYMQVGNTGFYIIAISPLSELMYLLSPISHNTLIFGILFLLVTIIVIIIITKSITNPLVVLTNYANEFAIGNLTVNISGELTRRNDEIAHLAEAFMQMREKIAGIIRQVKNSSAKVADGGNKLNKSALALSERTIQQATSAEEVSASTEEMSASITQSAENSSQTQRIVSKAAEDSQRGGDKVKLTIEAVNTICNNVATIEDIAFQTNILALNAAVEAARAGENGKGFAVIAAEVQKLAEHSKISAREINNLANNSVKIVDETGKIFTNLIPDIKKSYELVQEIASASREQDIGTNQITSAILELDKLTQENASAAEDFSKRTNEFVIEAEEMQNVVSYFKID